MAYSATEKRLINEHAHYVYRKIKQNGSENCENRCC